MSLYKSLSIGLSVAQNVQQRQTNRLLSGMLTQQNLDQQHREAISAQKDTIFEFSTEVDATAGRGEYPTALLLSLRFQLWCKNLSISAASFAEFSDKQFFQQVRAKAEKVRADAQSLLAKDVIAEVERLAHAPELLSCLAKLKAWLEIDSKMKGGWFVWNGINGFFYFVLFMMAASIPLAIVSKVDPKAAGAFSLCLFGGIPVVVYRRVVAGELSQTAQAIGGTGLASKKWTPIQAALMSFSFCLFSKATGEI